MSPTTPPPASAHLDHEISAARTRDLYPETSQPTRQPRRLDQWLSYVIFACGIVTVAVGIYLIVSSWTPVPMWDEWQEIDIIAKAPNHLPPLTWLWSQHNEMRTLFYHLLLLADIRFFHGQRWIEYAGIIAAQGGFLIMLVWVLRRERLRGPLFWTVAGLGAFCLFCPSQWENFFWAIQIVVYLPGVLFLVSLLTLLQYQRSVRWQYLVLSILAAAGATYSFGNGMVAWPLLCAITLVLGLRLRFFLLYLAFSFLLVGSYFWHYVPPNPDLAPWRSLRHPLVVLEYVSKLLGVALPPWMHIRDLVAFSTGALGLAAALAVTVWFLVRDRRRTPLVITMFGLMFYALATACVNALGRIGLGVADQPFQSRYQPYSLLFWFSVITLWLLVVDRTVPFLRTAILLIVSLGMVMAAGALFPLCLRAAHLLTLRSEAAALALVTGVPDKQALVILNPFTSVPWEDAEYFRQNRLFMFSGSWYAHMNEPLASVYRVVPRERCAGQVDKVEPLPLDDSVTGKDTGGLRVSGWAANNPSGDPAQSVVVAADGRIVGYGVGGLLTKTSGSKTFLKQAKFVQWWGFARPPSGSTHLDFYAAGVGNEACPLATVDLPSR